MPAGSGIALASNRLAMPRPATRRIEECCADPPSPAVSARQAARLRQRQGRGRQGHQRRVRQYARRAGLYRHFSSPNRTAENASQPVLGAPALDTAPHGSARPDAAVKPWVTASARRWALQRTSCAADRAEQGYRAPGADAGGRGRPWRRSRDGTRGGGGTTGCRGSPRFSAGAERRARPPREAAPACRPRSCAAGVEDEHVRVGRLETPPGSGWRDASGRGRTPPSAPRSQCSQKVSYPQRVEKGRQPPQVEPGGAAPRSRPRARGGTGAGFRARRAAPRTPPPRRRASPR